MATLVIVWIILAEHQLKLGPFGHKELIQELKKPTNSLLFATNFMLKRSKIESFFDFDS